jgi:hypothetical protein
MRRSIPPLASLLLAGVSPWWAPLWAVQTDTHGIHAVPAPAPVVIDGKLDEWDLSGQVLQCYDVEALVDVYSARIAMEYDAANLYIAIHWKDPIPLGNSHDPHYQADKGWAGDSVQLRLKTDRIAHVTAWCYAAKHQPAMQIEYGKSLTEPFGGGSRLLLPTEGWKLDGGAEMGFLVDADGKGYVQEMKLPWALITNGRPYAAGSELACGIELLWGESDWPVHRYADNLAEGATSREFFWTAKDAWGPVWLEPAGRLTLPPPAWRKALEPEPAQGPVEIAYTLPADARVTLAIDDAGGRRVRNLVPALPRGKGANVERWDGLDDDGKAVPPGDYVFKGIHHQGIHTTWEMSFASPGNPSWDTPDGRGAFYADHSLPQAVAAGGAYVALACPMGEGGKHLIGCDLSGQRLWGLSNRTAFDGGRISLATDGTTLWVGNESKASTIYRVELATGRYSPWKRTATSAEGKEYQVLDLEASALPGMNAAKPGQGRGVPNLTAIAERDGVLAVCLMREDAVKLLDSATGEVRTTLAVPAPRAVVFDRDGSLIVLSKESLLRVTRAGALSPFTTTPLADAYGLAIDAQGYVYASMRGGIQDIYVFGADGRLSHEIGKLGGRPVHGPFERGAVRQPAGLGIDGKGRLWVAEETENPKRTSVWSADGTLDFDLIGTARYSGAGAINPFDPTMGFAVHTVFQLDHATGASRPVWSLGGSGEAAQLFPPLEDYSDTSRMRVVVRDGATWVYSTGTARGATEVACTMFKDGVWRAACHFGQVVRKDEGEWAKYLSPLFAGHDGQHYVWCDANGDGLVQADELQFGTPAHAGRALALRSHYWGQLPDTDGTVTYLALAEQALVKWPVIGVTACGAPRYDLASPQVVPVDQRVLGGGEGTLMGGSDGRVYVNQEPLVAIDRAGKVIGTYPSRHVSVHGSHTAKASRPGYLIGPSAFLGTADLGGGIGEVFDLNGNLGENYLFTQDCLYIQALFKDVRGGFETPLRAVRGMSMDATTAGGESFGGNFVRTTAGKVYLTIGGTDARVLEVSGLDSIVRFGGRFTYRPEQYAAAQQLMQQQAAKVQAARSAVIAKAAAPVRIDGKPDEWPELLDDKATAIAIEESAQRRYARVGMRWDATSLYLAYRVFAPAGALRNAGQDWRLLFKTGDAVDLMLGGRGKDDAGLRLLMTMMGGQPCAVLYEKRVPGVAEQDRVPFSSPWRTIHFDRVAQLADVQLACGGISGGWFVEAAVPWRRLGVTPASGLKLSGDLGALSADSGGTTTVARHYWSNQATNLVNDVPGEADLAASLWGTFTLE